MVEVCKERTMGDNEMRQLSHLILQMRLSSGKDINGVDIVKLEHFNTLQNALVTLTSKDDGTGLKAGLKLSLAFTLKKVIKIMKGHYIEKIQGQTNV